MRLLLAILTGKLIGFITRKFKIGGGSAAPGLYALKIDPGLVEKLASKIPQNIVITGTNGKTTTSKMLAHFAANSGLKVIRNHTGSNLERGIASTLIRCSKLSNTRCWLDSNIGIWELDEAAFNSVVHKIKPQTIVFLNVFRDQLDRYGEVDTVVTKWCASLRKLPAKTNVIVNGDDQNTAKLAKCFKGKVQKFGVKDYKIIGESIEKKAEKENLDFEATDLKLNQLKGSDFILRTSSYPLRPRPASPRGESEASQLPANLPLPGIYHVYDFLAAFAAGTTFNLKPQRMVSTLKTYSPAFGRVEKLPFGYIFLIKNPAGATQVFETIAPHINQADRLLLALNDNLADGTDVSWIWDAQFEKLRTTNYELRTFCSGSRAADLAVRLKYAGFKPESMHIEPNLNNTLKEARKGLKGNLFILPTYTAMLELQRILAKSGIKKKYWEEEN